MLVPDYWAESIRKGKQGKHAFTIRRFGWSNLSAADAQRLADERAQAAYDQRMAGGTPHPRDFKLTYNGAQGLPIREEVVERSDDCVLSRNLYGALCLNVEDVLFADIDYQSHHDKAGLHPFLPLVFLLLGGVLAWPGSRSQVVIGLLLGGVLGLALNALSNQWRLRRAGGNEGLALSRLQAFLKQNRQWRVRVYRTPAGLRLLAMHARFDPTQSEAKEFFRVMGVDHAYRFMCEKQHCFRARLSAKPWRIGIEQRIGPRPGVWPLRPEHIESRQRWVRSYNDISQRFAACHFLAELGEGRVDDKCDRIRELHDRQSQALQTQLPMA